MQSDQIPLSAKPAPEIVAPVRRSAAGALFQSLRPMQWVKNGFVFAPLIFARGLTDGHLLLKVALAASIFCLVSSAVYLINDLADAPEDRNHPVKRFRPVASGQLTITAAVSAAITLLLLGVGGAWILDKRFFLIVALYVGLNILYSLALKHVMLLDAFIVAAGFVLRVLGGGLVIHVEISPWLVVCTTLLAIFLALTKRRHELVLLGNNASSHRATLAKYSPYFLDQLIGIVTASTLMAYALYTLSDDVARKFPGKRLELTIPFVLYGIFRYLYLVHQNEEGGNPTRLLLTDPVLLFVVSAWAISVVFIIYF